MPDSVIDRQSGHTDGASQPRGAFAASARSDLYAGQARAAVADLVGGVDPRGVVLGPNSTTLLFRLAQALAATWQPGDELVVSRLDHDANVRPWLIWAGRVGAIVRWVTPILPSTDLDPETYDDVLGERTRVVAVTAASNLTGSIPDMEEIAKRAHLVGATLVVDGVHATPHLPVDMVALGAAYGDLGYKWSGRTSAPMIADPAFWEPLRRTSWCPRPPGSVAVRDRNIAVSDIRRGHAESTTWPGSSRTPYPGHVTTGSGADVDEVRWLPTSSNCSLTCTTGLAPWSRRAAVGSDPADGHRVLTSARP